MAEEQTSNQEEQVEESNATYGKLEELYNKNKNTISTVALIVTAVVVAFVYLFKYYLPEQELEAQEQMFVAEKYFEQDSLELAIHGDGNYYGFLEIIDEYSMTKAANLANYYAGICYLKQGEYETAIDYLKDFDADDVFLSTLALMGIGDAYMELGETDEGISYYEDASDNELNEFLTPYCLLKTGMALEINEEFEDAKSMYEQIKEDYPESIEGKAIDKYIARVDVKLQ